jgi:hypothetical protein
VGGGAQLGPLGPAATVPAPGDYDVGEISGAIGRGTEVLGENLPPVPLCPPQTRHATRTRDPGRRCGKPVTNRLSYGTALNQSVSTV